jgi:hypothetical protein
VLLVALTVKSLLPSRDVIAIAIDIYFSCVHRQPLWLFDYDGSLSPNSCEELILSVLSLSIQYAPSQFRGFQLQYPKIYSNAARTLVMHKIADGDIELSSIQSLCLLAFSNLVCKENTSFTQFTRLKRTTQWTK